MSVARRGLLVLAPLLVCALIGGATPDASAQCVGPDGLDVGPCCGPVVPALPPFPGVTMPALGACWDRCTQGLQRTLSVVWTPPAQIACTEYTTTLTVIDTLSALPILTGKLVLDYTRTWTEIDGGGNPIPVWRFAAKADLGPAPGGPIVNCPVPPCIAPVGPYNTAFYYGYVDYTTCAVAGPWQNVLVLYHGCDRFMHMAGLSDKPGLFHPGQAYAIIAPHSALQPFVPGNAIAFGGNLVGEATRDLSLPPAVCTREDPVTVGAMTKLGAGCVCDLQLSPKHQTLRQFQGFTTCLNAGGQPGAWASVNVNWPVLPWYHMISSSIGTWSNPNIYPGKESAWVDEGLFVHQGACTGNFVEMKYGGSTKGGFQTILPSGSTTNFTDLADNYTAPQNGPYPTPILGSIRQTDHLIYVNEP